MEILILHPGGLGDLILSLPAIHLIRCTHPSARITIAGNIDHLGAIASGYADEVISLAALPLHRLYSEEPVPELDATFWNSFDWIISWTGSGNRMFEAKFARLHPCVHVAQWRPCLGEPRHVSQLFVDSLNLDSHSGCELPLPCLHLSAELRGEGIQWLAACGWNGQDRIIAICPGAGSRKKRWPLSNFTALAQSLAMRQRTKLLLISGPADPDLSAQIAAMLPASAAFRADSIPLSRLAAVLVHCQAFAGNDSGIAHLSAALGIRSIVLFGPTLPGHWAPRGNHVTVLSDTSGCEACVSHGTSHTCLQNITPAAVLGAVSPISIFPA